MTGHDEYRESVAAYALDALDRDEKRAFESYRDNDDCDFGLVRTEAASSALRRSRGAGSSRGLRDGHARMRRTSSAGSGFAGRPSSKTSAGALPCAAS